MSRKAVIGNADNNGNFWLYDSETGFDLTHPTSVSEPQTANAVTLPTTTDNITIDPRKSALVIIDMQNFFLSPALGRPAESKGLNAQDMLLEYAIPAARTAGIQIVWLNWGLSQSDLDVMPPAEFRAFGFSTLSSSMFDKIYSVPVSGSGEGNVEGAPLCNDLGKNPKIYKGLGQSLGEVTLEDGKVVSAGYMLMRQQWNTDLTPALQDSFRQSGGSSRPDVWLNKVRMSGLHVPGSPAGLYFQNHGIKTLVFAGVNTDQCVNGTLTDAFCQGYDCILLRDGCATTSAVGAQECVENNVARNMGFLTTCQDFSVGIARSLKTQGPS